MRASRLKSSSGADSPSERAPPVVMELRGPAVDPLRGEWMEIPFAEIAPVLEIDAQLVGAADLAQKLGFVEFEQQIEVLDRRNGGFADTHGPDGVGLDKVDIQFAAEGLGHGGRRHPSGRAAADDDHFA